MPLVACPFCRELFDSDEAADCPSCDLALAAVAKLPPSPTLRPEVDDWDEDLGPEHDRLPWTFHGRGRGALVLLCLAGIVLFLLPWIDLRLPYSARLSGWDLARKAGWSWAALAAWVVLLPTVASRRSIYELRGARVAAVFLAAIPAITAGILVALPPRGGLLPVVLDFDWPLYATIVVSVVAMGFGVRLGGRVDVLVAKQGTSQGEVLH